MTSLDQHVPNVDRRTFLKGAAAGAAAISLSAGHTARAQFGVSPASAPPARNVILLVGDGLDMGALPIAQLYCERKLGRNLHCIDWLREGGARRSLLDASCASDIVTDSAAAASCWSIGVRTNRDVLSITPDGQRPTPLLIRARNAGYAVGAMTNTEVLDATPAAMFANAPSRSDIELITQQMFAANLDLLIGGGARRFTPEMFANQSGLTVADSPAALAGALEGPDRVLGLLAEGDLPFEIERPGDFPSFPELTAMTLRRMASLDKPFTVVIESEHIDTSTHANDAATMMREIISWDEGLKVCRDYCAEHPDTLLIALSDHSNSAPAFACYTDEAEAQFEALCASPHSYRWLMREYRARGGDPNAVDLVALVRDTTGVTITSDEAATLARWFGGQPVDPFNERNAYLSPIGSILGNHFGVAFATYRHTTSWVEALATGPGSERMPHFGHQTNVHDVITSALGLA
jgi:alkaline phosphatase